MRAISRFNGHNFFSLMADYPIFPFDNAKVRKNHVFCKLNRKKDTKKDTF